MRSALTKRLGRLRGELADLPEREEEDELFFDERYEGEQEEQDVLLDDHQIREDEIEKLEQLLGLPVKEDKKLTKLLELVDQIETESARGAEEKVLIFTEYRETQNHLVRQLEEKYGKGSVVVIHGGMKLERSEDRQDIDTIWAPFANDGALVA